MTNPAIALIQERIDSLNQIDQFSSQEEEANHIDELAQLDNAIKQLTLCQAFGINGDAVINALPETGNIHHCYRVAVDNGSNHIGQWDEVKFNNERIIFAAGDCIVRV